MKNKALRRVMALACTVVMMVSLCACSSKGDKEPSSQELDKAAESTQDKADAGESSDTNAPVISAQDTAPAGDGTIDVPGGEGHIKVLLGDVRVSETEENSYRVMASTEYEQIYLDDSEKEKYPGLQAAFEEYNRKRKADNDEMMETLVSNYKEIKPYFAEDEMPEITCETTAKMMRADEQIISMYNSTYMYLGGAHPNQIYGGKNYDPATGAVLKLTDVILDMDRFAQICNEKIEEHYPDTFEYLYDVKDYFKDTDPAEDDSCWTMDSEGLTYYFNEYSLGSYAAGSQIVYIGFEEAPELFPEKYTKTPENYVIPLAKYGSVYVDVNGDSKREDVHIDWNPADEEAPYYNFAVAAGKRSVSFENWTYTQESYVLKANGAYYLYLFETGDNDYTILNVVDLRTMEASRHEGNSSPTGVGGDWIEEGNVTSYSSISPCFTDPALFAMDTRMECMGTYTGVRTYHADAKGMPEADQDYYTARCYTVCRAKMDADCDLVNEKGEKVGSDKIREGTAYAIVRTDNSSWVDIQEVPESMVNTSGDEYYSYMYLDDDYEEDFSKPVYRLKVELVDYERTVNGVEEYDLFDGIMYAG